MKDQKAWIEQYQKENIKRVVLKLNRVTEESMISWVEGKENVNGYLKELIRKDMEMKKAGA